LHGGVEILTTRDGARFATSTRQLDMLYRVTETTCECQAGLAGDPVCCHRAALRDILGTLPVVVVHIDELGLGPCRSCQRGKVEEWCCGHVSGFAPCGVCGGSGVMPVAEPELIAA